MTQSIYAVPAALNADAYKSGHIAQYPKGMNSIMLNMTPRSSKYFNTPLQFDGVVVFGIQRFVCDYLRDHWNNSFFKRPREEAVREAVDLMNGVVFGSPVTDTQWYALHDLGYLPVMVDALPEGSLCPIKVPMLTFQNTHPSFTWVAGYLEDAFSNEIWKATTIATIAMHYKRIFLKHAELTCDDDLHVPYQGHDFAMRGMSGMTDDAFNAVGHLTSFMGSDSFAAVYTAKRTYGQSMAYNEIGATIPATEHTVMCANIAVEKHFIEREYELQGKAAPDEATLLSMAEVRTFERLLTEVYPSGLVSIVSDTNNYWDTITHKAIQLRETILKRDGKVVFRPDSGKPFHVVCGYRYITFEDAQKIVVQAIKDGRAMAGEGVLEQAINAGNAVALPCKGYLKDIGYELIVEDECEWGAHTLNLETFEVRYMDDAEIKGSIATLDYIFGSTKNKKGYKLLNPKIGLIYGDSITMELADKILTRLKELGYAASNVVFGIGSYTYQFLTRDTFGFAVKGTACWIQDMGFLALSKDPITDRGLKKSAKGCTQVLDCGGDLKLQDGLTFDEYEEIQFEPDEDKRSAFKTLFIDSQVIERNLQTLKNIREKIDSLI